MADPGPAADGAIDPAAEEAKQLSRGLSTRDLKKEADEADHDRSQQFKDHFETMAVIAVWLLFTGFITFGVIWAIHVGWPQHGWLTGAQLDKVEGLLTGGIIAGLVSDHVRKRMG